MAHVPHISSVVLIAIEHHSSFVLQEALSSQGSSQVDRCYCYSPSSPQLRLWQDCNFCCNCYGLKSKQRFDGVSARAGTFPKLEIPITIEITITITIIIIIIIVIVIIIIIITSIIIIIVIIIIIISISISIIIIIQIISGTLTSQVQPR
jgi:hypothetical protein